MHLLYLDESGKSGPKDFDQPWYVLGGLIVHEDVWRAVESELNARIDVLVPPPRDEEWELHMAWIHHRKRFFAGVPATVRFGLVDAVFDVLEKHKPTLIFVGIDKKKHDRKYRYPRAVEDLAYEFMLERFNTHVGRHRDKLGVVICDEQKELEVPTRRAHSLYRRVGTGATTIEHVIETPFFTASHWSRMLQIVDVAAYYVARHLRGATTASYWPRIERLLDGYPEYGGKGLKRFP